jgi:hypothetical protein
MRTRLQDLLGSSVLRRRSRADGLHDLRHRQCACPENSRQTKYRGLIFHDLRRTAARNLRRAGVAENIIMQIGGWRTRSVFDRYAIITENDIADAVRKLETDRKLRAHAATTSAKGHVSVTFSPEPSAPASDHELLN